MPVTAALVNTAFGQLIDLGNHGNVRYFACRLPTPDFLDTFASSFHAARQPPAGFQLTVQVLKKYPGFELASRQALLDTSRRLNPFDRAALNRL